MTADRSIELDIPSGPALGAFYKALGLPTNMSDGPFTVGLHMEGQLVRIEGLCLLTTLDGLLAAVQQVGLDMSARQAKRADASEERPKTVPDPCPHVWDDGARCAMGTPHHGHPHTRPPEPWPLQDCDLAGCTRDHAAEVSAATNHQADPPDPWAEGTGLGYDVRHLRAGLQFIQQYAAQNPSIWAGQVLRGETPVWRPV